MRPPPPSTSHVSLPSQIGATEFIIVSRSSSVGTDWNRMPMPRSKPSISTYMKTAKAITAPEISGRSRSISVLLHHSAGRSDFFLWQRHRPRRRALAQLRLVLRPPHSGPGPGRRWAERDYPQHVPGAGAENRRVGNDEQHQRQPDRGRGNRRNGIHRPHQPVDDVRLPADLGDEPAGQHGHKAGRSHQHPEDLEPPRLLETSAPEKPNAAEAGE